MKAERRHELKHNTLDSELGQMIQWVKNHGTAILWGIALAALAATLVIFLIGRVGAERRRLWAQYQQAVLDPDETLTPADRLAMLADVADQDSYRHLAAMAAMRMADLHMNTPYLQRGAGAAESWDQAKAAYERVIAEFGDEPTQVALAYVGLATLAENQGDLDTALTHYNAVLALPGAAGTPAAIIAQGRLQTLPLVAELMANPVLTPGATGEEQLPGLDIDSMLRDPYVDDATPREAPDEDVFDPDPLNADR